MAARKKKAPARKAARKKPAPAAKKRAAPRAIPNDEAWRALVETAVEKPDPTPHRKAPAAASKPARRKPSKRK
jgi:hypothetical protein